jgi:hypothetical protein
MATTHKQLEEYLLRVMQWVIDETVKECLTVLKSFIWDDVYAYDYYPNKQYYNGTKEATMEFMNSFIQNQAKRKMFEVVGEIVYNWESMSVNQATGLHYNDALGGDIRKDLAEHLNTSGMFGYKQRNKFWDNYENWLKKNLYKIIEKNFKIVEKKGIW